MPGAMPGGRTSEDGKEKMGKRKEEGGTRNEEGRNKARARIPSPGANARHERVGEWRQVRAVTCARESGTYVPHSTKNAKGKAASLRSGQASRPKSRNDEIRKSKNGRGGGQGLGKTFWNRR